MNKKHTTLYNVIFPIWMLFIIPAAWLVILPANFLIDYAVLRLGMKRMVIEDYKRQAKRAILKTWIFGFISDIIGAVPMMGAMYLDTLDNPSSGWLYDNIVSPIAQNPFSSPYAFLWTLCSAAIAGLCIYFFNRYICFKGLDMDDKQKKKLAVIMAVCTAPYLFFLPTVLLFG